MKNIHRVFMGNMNFLKTKVGEVAYMVKKEHYVSKKLVNVT